MEKYVQGSSVGGGSFGQVYLVKNIAEGIDYVIKKIKTRDISDKDRENIENEVGLLKKLTHPNIVSYKESFMDSENYLCIVMAYCDGGDMYNKIRAEKNKNFTESQILDWLTQLSLALHYLHEKKILHRDLKTQNIFIRHGRLVFGDFGIAKVLDSTRDLANTCIGTPYYMSPEQFKYKPYSYKSDIWALGCVMYEIMNLKHAFTAQTLNGLAVKIQKGSYQPLNSSYSKSLQHLVTQMLSVNPKERPSIQDIIDKPMVKKRIILYMIEILKAPASDEFLQETIKDQCELLEIWDTVQQCLSNENANVNELINNNIAAMALQKQNEIASGGKGNPIEHLKSVKKSKEKELKKEMQSMNLIEEKIKKLETMKNELTGNLGKFASASQKNKILQEKERRKIEAQSRRESELQKIRNNIMKEKRQTKQKFDKNVHASSNMKKIFNKNSAEYYQNEFEDDYDDNDFEEDNDLEKIPEVENEQEDDADLQRKINKYKNQLEEKTQKVNTLRYTIKDTTTKINANTQNLNYSKTNDINEDEECSENSANTPFSLSDLEDENNEELSNPNSTLKKLKEKIKILQHRCETGLGKKMCEEAYRYLKEHKDDRPDELRVAMNEMLNDGNIGYWHLLEQILLFEDFLTSFESQSQISL